MKRVREEEGGREGDGPTCFVWEDMERARETNLYRSRGL